MLLYLRVVPRCIGHLAAGDGLTGLTQGTRVDDGEGMREGGFQRVEREHLVVDLRTAAVSSLFQENIKIQMKNVGLSTTHANSGHGRRSQACWLLLLLSSNTLLHLPTSTASYQEAAYRSRPFGHNLQILNKQELLSQRNGKSLPIRDR